ncbi:hypothetical protein Gohar_008797, partial [Gossypium harknessii]|nr:hypothetical protein [Gossypium harknessii]
STADDGGDDSLVGDRNTKNVCFKGLYLEVLNDMVVYSPLVQGVSWRDKVLGKGLMDLVLNGGFNF